MKKNDICPTMWAQTQTREGKIKHKVGGSRGTRKASQDSWNTFLLLRTSLASPSIECLGLGVIRSAMNLAMTATLTWNSASYVISPSFRYLTCRTGMAIASNADELISRPLILLVSLLSNQWMRFIYISFKIRCPRLALCNLTMGYVGWGVSPYQFRGSPYPVNGTSNCINFYDCQLFLLVFTKHLRSSCCFFYSTKLFSIILSNGFFFPKDIINFIFLCNVWLSSWKIFFQTFYFVWGCIQLHSPGDASGKEPACQCKRHKEMCGFHPWVRKIPWMRGWQPTQVFLLGESHGLRSLVG